MRPDQIEESRQHNRFVVKEYGWLAGDGKVDDHEYRGHRVFWDGIKGRWLVEPPANPQRGCGYNTAAQAHVGISQCHLAQRSGRGKVRCEHPL